MKDNLFDSTEAAKKLNQLGIGIFPPTLRRWADSKKIEIATWYKGNPLFSEQEIETIKQMIQEKKIANPQIEIYDYEQVSGKLKEKGITISGKTIMRWVQAGKISATAIHKKTYYFTEPDINRIFEYMKLQQDDPIEMT